MAQLHMIDKRPEISYYRLQDKNDTLLDRYVISTPQTRKICNIPELMGVKYTDHMLNAMTAALKYLPDNASILKTPQEQFCIFTFLRGGLNFGLREALYHAHGFNRHASAFMTSQRKLVNGKWHIRENQYRKIEIPDDATLLVGDVVATGTTLDIGFNIFLDHLRIKRKRLNNLIFFTIGCKNTEKILGEVDRKLRRMNPVYGQTIIIYIEGLFRMADNASPQKIRIPGTDLIRSDALVTPEFALSQYDEVVYPLERCTIYDAGSRSFDIPEYLHDVIDYWSQTKALAETGFTLYDALKERWPETGWHDFKAFSDIAKQMWSGLDSQITTDIHTAYKRRWSTTFKKSAKDEKTLISLCVKRLGELRS